MVLTLYHSNNSYRICFSLHLLFATFAQHVALCQGDSINPFPSWFVAGFHNTATLCQSLPSWFVADFHSLRPSWETAPAHSTNLFPSQVANKFRLVPLIHWGLGLDHLLRLLYVHFSSLNPFQPKSLVVEGFWAAGQCRKRILRVLASTMVRAANTPRSKATREGSVAYSLTDGEVKTLCILLQHCAAAQKPWSTEDFD